MYGRNASFFDGLQNAPLTHSEAATAALALLRLRAHEGKNCTLAVQMDASVKVSRESSASLPKISQIAERAAKSGYTDELSE